MSKRLTAKGWEYLKKEYPDDVRNMYRIDVPVNRFNLLLKKRLRKNPPKTPKKKKITNAQRYGHQLGEILDWLDENCTEVYFPRFAEEEQWSLTPDKVVEFYFMDEADAMAFKLMFQ